jgi:hypothetical protein
VNNGRKDSEPGEQRRNDAAARFLAELLRAEEINRSVAQWIESNLNALRETVTDFTTTFTKSFAELFPPDFAERLAHMQQRMDSEHEAYVTLARRHHWLVPSWFPWSTMRVFKEILDEERHAGPALRHMFIAEFADDDFALLTSMIERWRVGSILTYGRWKILRDCAETMKRHADDRYNGASVAVPAIIAVIDGTLADFAMHDLSMTERWFIPVKSLLTKNDRIDTAIAEPASHLAFDVLFGGARPRKTPLHGMGFNRHKIMHGEFVRYGTAANALRAFFVVDFLVDAIQQYRAAKPPNPL